MGENKHQEGKENILITVGAGAFISLLIFIIVFICTLMAIGIIDIEDSIYESEESTSSTAYTEVTSNTDYWWPVGSTNSILNYDHGNPASLDITSGYGNQEEFRNSKHGGIDIGNAGNGPGVINIIASKEGYVTYPNSISEVSYNDNGYYGNPDGGGYGNYVIIDHQDGTQTLYAHLAKDSVKVIAGQKVAKGQVIGKMGNSGSSTGTHLHFEVRVNGARVFPLDYIDANKPRTIRLNINYINGDSNKQSICLSLKANNISNNGVIALMTNIYKESSFNTSTLGDEGTSYGLCQWHNERYTNLQNTFPDTYQTVEGQINFLIYELANGYPTLYNDLLNGTSEASDLTYQFCKKFEIPADTEKACKTRGEMAKDFTNYVINNCQ